MAAHDSTRKNWTAIEEVQDQISRAADIVAREHMRRFVEFTYWDLLHGVEARVIESPLEAIFRVWWSAHEDGFAEYSSESRLRLFGQQEVSACGKPYRLDFVVGLQDPAEAQRFTEAGRSFPLLAVEVDGHGFHEKTPAQVALRNSRDRALQQEGWVVFHFSWSEMVSDGWRHAKEVIDVAVAAYNECRRAEATKWADANPDAFQRAIDAMKTDQGGTK